MCRCQGVSIGEFHFSVIHIATVFLESQIQVGACGVTGAADISDELAFFDVLIFLQTGMESGQVKVFTGAEGLVLNFDVVACAFGIPSENNDTVAHASYRGSPGRRKINARVGSIFFQDGVESPGTES